MEELSFDLKRIHGTGFSSRGGHKLFSLANVWFAIKEGIGLSAFTNTCGTNKRDGSGE